MSLYFTYIHINNWYVYGVPGEIRTPDRRLRRPLLYPAELLRQFLFNQLVIKTIFIIWYIIFKVNKQIQ